MTLTNNSLDSYASSIPRCIPDGEYLVRIQQIGLHNPGAAPQVSFLGQVEYPRLTSC